MQRERGVGRRWLPVGVFIWAVVLTAVVITSPKTVSALEDELPDGEGKKILLTSCTSCHEFQEVTKFRGYFTRAQWRDLLVTMGDYGAPIDSRQIDVLADYLTLHLGRK